MLSTRRDLELGTVITVHKPLVDKPEVVETFW